MRWPSSSLWPSSLDVLPSSRSVLVVAGRLRKSAGAYRPGEPARRLERLRSDTSLPGVFAVGESPSESSSKVRVNLTFLLLRSSGVGLTFLAARSGGAVASLVEGYV